MQAIENDCILLQTDISFNLAIETLNSLQRDNQLRVCSYQVVTVENIESDDCQDKYRSRFGGSHAATRSLQCFARTASSVLRMCMGRSVNASFYPKLGPRSHDRNRRKMNYECQGEHFVLAPKDKISMMEYYSYYDHLHPHFRIEHQFTSAQPTDWWYMPLTMMLIFRQNFTEVIEISTTLQAGHRPQYGVGTYQSFVNVRCIVRRVSNPEHGSLKLLMALKNDPSEILWRYQQALNLPNFDLIGEPGTAETSEESDVRDDEVDEVSDSEADISYVQAEINPTCDTPNQATIPQPPNLFSDVPRAALPVIHRLGNHFATLSIAGQP